MNQLTEEQLGLQELQARFAGHVLSTNQIDNLMWAKEFMNNYEKRSRQTKEVRP